MSNEDKILIMLEKHGAILETYGAVLETLAAGQQQTSQQLDRLESNVHTLKSDVAAITSDITTLKSDVLEYKYNINRKLEVIEKYLIALSHHQDTDYDFIQATNKRIDILTAVSHDHEQKFQKLKAI